MSARGGRKRPSGAEYRRRRAARLVAEAAAAARPRATAQLGPAPLHDPSELVSWIARVGAALIEETLHDSSLTEADRRKAVANLIAKVGLVSSKSQFAGRVEAIEKRLSELTAPASNTDNPAADTAEPPIVIPARGTPLWRAWQARGALPPDGANVVEAPETSRAYAALVAKEPT